VVCLWAHLPESDFLQNVRKIDSSAHKAAIRYPAVTFRYCTAVEAMQRWRRTADTTRPLVTLVETGGGDPVSWQLSVDEPIFQSAPFIALKDRYERYAVLPATHVSGNTWRATSSVPRADLAKVGVAVTDTAGNLSVALVRYLPEDVYVDDADPGFSPLSGSWVPSSAASWGTTSHRADLPALGSGSVRWSIAGTDGAVPYNIFVQLPGVPGGGARTVFHFHENGVAIDSVEVTGRLSANAWYHLFTRRLAPALSPTITMTVSAGSATPATVYADVIKCSPLVRDRWVKIPETLDGGETIAGEANRILLPVQNLGIQSAAINDVRSASGAINLTTPLPASIPPMSSRGLELTWTPADTGNVTDTLLVASDDPLRPVQPVLYRAHVRHYFRLVDDRDSLGYGETGSWAFSSAGGFSSTSRYAYPAPGISATFSTRLARSGSYDVESIVPKTVNASVRARYLLAAGGAPVDSVFIDQNAGSGNWVRLMNDHLPADTPVTLTITDAMDPIVSGKVLRADAIRFQWLPGATDVKDPPAALPSATALDQNSPNPFNPATLLRFRLGRGGRVELTVHDLLGREVARLVDGILPAGEHQVRFDAAGFASGIYLALLRTDGFRQARKMTLLR
jgi:hypothetical protein